MTDTDWQPCFREGSDTEVDIRWRQLFDWLNRWDGLNRNPPLSIDRIDEVPETIDGHSLSKSIRYWHLTGAYPGRDDLVLRAGREHSAIEIMCAGEGEHCWGVRLDDLGLEDPPVYLFEYEWWVAETDSESPVRLCHPHLSGFAFEYMMAHLPCSHADSVTFSQNVFDDLSTVCGNTTTFFGHRLFESDQLLIRLWDRPIGSRTVVVVYPLGRETGNGIRLTNEGTRYIDNIHDVSVPRSLRRLEETATVPDWDSCYAWNSDRWDKS